MSRWNRRPLPSQRQHRSKQLIPALGGIAVAHISWPNYPLLIVEGWATIYAHARQGERSIDPAQKICIVRSHPSDKNKGVARVGHPILCSYFGPDQ
jgi:hypothetical protein